jgi:hypothetical protein
VDRLASNPGVNLWGLFAQWVPLLVAGARKWLLHNAQLTRERITVPAVVFVQGAKKGAKMKGRLVSGGEQLS